MTKFRKRMPINPKKWIPIAFIILALVLIGYVIMQLFGIKEGADGPGGGDVEIESASMRNKRGINPNLVPPSMRTNGGAPPPPPEKWDGCPGTPPC